MEQKDRGEIRHAIDKARQRDDVKNLADRLDIDTLELIRRAIQHYKFSLFLETTPEAQERLKLLDDEADCGPDRI